MRKHKDQVLGSLAQLLEGAAAAAKDGGAGVAEEVAGSGGGRLVGPERRDGGEVEARGGELVFGVVVFEEGEDGDGGAGVAGVVREFCGFCE